VESTENCQCVGVWSTGEEALIKIPAFQPQVVLMDINLPGMSGIELTVPQLTEQHVFVEYVNGSTVNEEAFIRKLHKNPYEAVLKDKQIITETDSVKTCFKLNFSLKLTDNNFEYEPGHAIDIICPNSDAELRCLFDHLNYFQIVNLRC
jgi:chemotaxis response regulator CheB